MEIDGNDQRVKCEERGEMEAIDGKHRRASAITELDVVDVADQCEPLK